MLYIKRQDYTLESDVVMSIISANGEIWLSEGLDSVTTQAGKREKLFTINMEAPDDQITLGGYKSLEYARYVMKEIEKAVLEGRRIFVMPEVN